MKFEKMTFTLPKGVKQQIEETYDHLVSKRVFFSRSHFLYCLFMYLEPMNDKFWLDLKTTPVTREKYQFEVITISVPQGGKAQFDRFFNRLHEQQIFKTRGELIQKILAYFKDERDNFQFWGHVASWFLGRETSSMESHTATETGITVF